MICYEFKGVSGSASRRGELDGQAYTVASLVQANYGIRPWLTILGVPVGRHLTAERILSQGETGSIIVMIATDASMLPHQLQRVARRGTIGIGRCGSPGGNNSGDIFLAFSVANAETLAQRGQSRLGAQFIDDSCFGRFYQAAVESVEEAIVNALLAAEDMSTLKLPGDRICRAIPHDQLPEVMQRYGRCA